MSFALLEAAPGYVQGRPPYVLDEFAYGTVTQLARPKAGHRLLRRTLASIGWAVATVVVILLALPSVGVAFGYRTLIVTSGSMEPTAMTGDAVVLQRVDPHEVAVGDVVTFRPLRDGGVTTHRVASVHEVEGAGTHFRTRGDNNADFDPNLVPARNVLGRVVTTAPKVGRAYAFAATTAGRMLFVGLPALLIIVAELRRMLRRPPTAPGPKLHVPRRRRSTTSRAMGAAAAASIVCVLAVPALAIFSSASALAGNAMTAGRVNAPNLTAASAQLIPCRVNLTWTAPATGLSPDGYDIYRATTSGGPYTFRKHVGAVTSTADDTGPLAALTTYHYVIRSTRSSWTSVNSNQRSVTTLLCAL